ncbi:Type II secretion system protein D precursor [Aquisphaera giovannonii]|uniref:Type II secretion system protein D n=1 Tax=Aquisphaera giovannonii TaxID=406548 RepID=A0A5B9W7E6_9BACT|nr:hypothetical protein [Aquisphaera giovannonii]QEH35850.1 Type II secretion system protein D precursor [Aquisphaera giovannonii]
MNRTAFTAIKSAPICLGLMLVPCLGAGARGADSGPPAAGRGPAPTPLSATDAQEPPQPPAPGLGGAATPEKDQVPRSEPLPQPPGGGGGAPTPAGRGRVARPSTTPPAAPPAAPAAGEGAGPEGKGEPAGAAEPQEVRFDDDGLVTLHTNELDVRQLLELLSRRGRLNILVSPKVSGTITANFEKVALEDLLRSVLKLAGLVERDEGGMRFIYSREEVKDEAEGRKKERIITKVYRLNYVRADEVMVMLTPFLSEDVGRKRFATTPNYQFGVSEASTLATGGSLGAGAGGGVVGGGGVGSGAVIGGAGTIQRGTQPATGGASMSGNDVLVIQDYESNLKIIDQIVARLDVQPVQVLIEAVIISVELDKEQQLGVNFAVVDNLGQQLGVIGAGAAINGNVGFTPAQVLTAAGKIATSTAAADATGFASTTNGIKYGFVSNNVTGFVRALETVGSTKVLASPRVLVLNKQRAEIQLGSRLGFRTLSQNFTSTIQQVQFLNVGTLLRLRPFVSNDGMVRLEIHPERSQGVVVDDLPSATTAELTTNVMVPDGATLVIGGLMEDEDDYTSQGLPGISHVPLLGHLFGNKDKIDRRRELVVLLTPHIWSAEAAGRDTGEASLRRPAASTALAAGPAPAAPSGGPGEAGSAAAIAPARPSASRGGRRGAPAEPGPEGAGDVAAGPRPAMPPAGRPAGEGDAPPAARGPEASPGSSAFAAPSPPPSALAGTFTAGAFRMQSGRIDESDFEVADTLEADDRPPAAVAAAETAPTPASYRPQAPATGTAGVTAWRPAPASPPRSPRGAATAGGRRPSRAPKVDPALSLASAGADDAPRRVPARIPDLTPVPASATAAVAPASAPTPVPSPAPERRHVVASERRHVVAAGEDFGSIAERYYGTPGLARALWWANRGEVAWPGALAAGTRLVVPPRERLRDVPATAPAAPRRAQARAAPRGARQATRDSQIQLAAHPDAPPRGPAASAAPQARPPQQGRAPRGDGGVSIHVVRRRETLRSIAEDRLGDPARAGEVAALNREMLSEAGGVNVGMRLLLPADAGPLSPPAGGAGR